MNIYDIEVKDINGNEVSLSKYKNKVMLIVNTATGCGFTPQYVGLQELYVKYQSKGLEILDFPCNQFANQTPESNEEIVKFCVGKFGVTFDQFAKIEVNGSNEDNLYKYLKKNSKGMFGKSIKWNFTKFLVDKNGKVVGRFAPTVTPDQLENKIIKLLDK